MKEKIKSILRERMTKNILGFDITRPTQELIIMRGCPGSGKSTLAKSLAKEGVIHSTDSVIESLGDYNEFFAKMTESKDFSPLSKAHSKNLSNTLTSLKEGISPVVFDNTCLRIGEISPIVEAALELGIDEKNIRIEDVESNLSAEELATRNTHGVPLEKIKAMMETKKSVGVLTVEKIVESIKTKRAN